jgi:hypothetical protein
MRSFVTASLLAFGALAPVHAAQFNYHGDLLDGDAPADGRYDLRVTAYAQPSAQQPIAPATELPGVTVSEGRFSVQLEVPEDVDGMTWVEVAIRAAGEKDYVALGSPQPISKANSTCPGAWALDGNTSLPGGSFLGIADVGDDSPLELRAQNRRIAWLLPGGTALELGDAPRVMLGSSANLAASFGATVGGGGSTLTENGSACSDCANLASERFSTVAGGRGNQANGQFATVSGGLDHRAGALGATVGGGIDNTASGEDSVVSGGIFNDAGPGAGASVGGGNANHATAAFSTVAGGGQNAARAPHSTVPGGSLNCAGGDFSFAAGAYAKVRHGNGAGDTACSGATSSGDANGDEGTFVWADAAGTPFVSGGPNRFMARADGGVMFNTATPPAPDFDDLVVGTRAFSGDPDADLRLVTRSGRSGVLFVSDSSGALRITMDDLIVGATYIDVGNGASLSNGGVWTNASSRALKHAFAAVDPADILRRVRALPITTWSYKDSAEGRHLGPVAEDFKAAFGLAGDGRSIPTVDADGVALAAIQGLDARLDDERDALRAENAALREQLDRLRSSLDALTARLQRVEDVRSGE